MSISWGSLVLGMIVFWLVQKFLLKRVTQS